MAKRFNEEQSIQDVLKNFISHNKLQTGIDKIEVKDVWFSTMGNGVANYTEEVELKKEALYVKLTSSVLREELMFGKEKIIKTVGEKGATFQAINFKSASQPYYVLLDNDLRILNKPIQYTSKDKYLNWLKEGLSNL